MRIPLDNPPPMSQDFGVPDTNAKFGLHAGIDYPVGTGTPVYACITGTVSIVQNDQYHGNVIDIQNGDKWYRVMHLRDFAVTYGIVQEGELIGYSDNTGLSTGPHLHWDVRTQYNPTSFAAFINPLSLLIPQGGDNVNDKVTIVGAPAVASWQKDRLDVFARGSDDGLWHKWFNDRGWSVWEKLSGGIASSPAAAAWEPNRLDVFATGVAGDLMHFWFANGWLGPESLGAPKV